MPKLFAPFAPLATLAFLAAFAATVHADYLQIGYVSGVNGKTAKSHLFSLHNGKQISPDTLEFGSVFKIRPFGAYPTGSVCNRRGEMGLQFLVPGGTAYRRPNHDTNWAAYSTFPPLDSLVPLNTVPTITPLFTEPGDLTVAPGYVIGKPGDLNCQWDNFDFVDSTFSQIIFIKSGGVYAKLKITGYKVTVPGMPEPVFQNNILDTITVRYMVHDNPADMGDGPTAIHAAPTTRGQGTAGVKVAFAWYNPLGIRVEAPGRYQTTVPRLRR